MRRFSAVIVCVVTGQAQDLKVAFVDLQKFASKSVKAQTMQKKLMDLMNTKRTALENKKKELQELQEKLQKQGPMLKEDTRNQMIKEIGIKEMEFKLAEKEAQNSLQNEEREMMEVFQRDLTKIIAQIRVRKATQWSLTRRRFFPRMTPWISLKMWPKRTTLQRRLPQQPRKKRPRLVLLRRLPLPRKQLRNSKRSAGGSNDELYPGRTCPLSRRHIFRNTRARDRGRETS